jgi:hypothetical protein
MKTLTILVVVIILAMASPASAATYSTPKMYDADGLACDKRHPELNMMADVQWANPSKGTGYTLLKYSTSKSFSSPKYVHPNDLHTYPSQAKGDIIYRVDGLKPNKTYYFKVAVSNFEGDQRLSDYSKVASAKTRTCS